MGRGGAPGAAGAIARSERLAAFASALPRIRARVERDLARPGLPHARVVRLLEETPPGLGSLPVGRRGGRRGRDRLLRRERVPPDEAARQLGNTAAICRKSYVHPAVLDAYADGVTLATVRGARPVPGLRPEEARVLCLLERAGDGTSVRRAG
jgi:DNA topoisomerase IB